MWNISRLYIRYPYTDSNRVHPRGSRSETSRAQAGDKELKSQLKQLEQKLQKEVTSRTDREADLKREVETKLAEISSYRDAGFGSVGKLTQVRL